MILTQKNLFLVFALCFTLLLAMPLICPSLRLFFLVPFLVILFYQKSFIVCLWGAFGCGLILDLLSSRPHFGLYALDYVFTTAWLYHKRKHFFGDSLSTLPLMVLFFSVLSTVIYALLAYIVEKESFLTWKWLLTDVVVMPLGDAAYAFIVFIAPFVLLGKRLRKGSEYFSS